MRVQLTARDIFLFLFLLFSLSAQHAAKPHRSLFTVTEERNEKERSEDYQILVYVHLHMTGHSAPNRTRPFYLPIYLQICFYTQQRGLHIGSVCTGLLDSTKGRGPLRSVDIGPRVWTRSLSPENLFCLQPPQPSIAVTASPSLLLSAAGDSGHFEERESRRRACCMSLVDSF